MACGGCEAAKRRAEAAAAQKQQKALTAEEIRAAQAKIPQANQQSTLGNTQSFALKMRDGSKVTFGSRLEAEAENVRRGYTGTVKPA